MDHNVRDSRKSDVDDPKFHHDSVRQRMEALRMLGLNQALPRLMLELDGIMGAALSADDRVGVLRLVKKPVLKALAGLPKPRGNDKSDSSSVARGMMLEQRLVLLMTRNLRHALHELDRAQGSYMVDDDSDRTWILQQLFRFMGRQIRYGIDWDRPWPKHTWQDLHDLFVYLVVRGTVQMDSGFTVAAFDEDFDAEIEYKRLVLLGLADRLTNRRGRTGDFYHMLKRWAVDSKLRDPERSLGEGGVVKIEVTRDEPPRLREGKLKESFRGWVLTPSDAFTRYVANVNSTGGRVLRFNSFRSTPSSTAG